MYRYLICIIVSIICVGCSTKLTTSGSQVKLISETNKTQCNSIAVVTGSSSVGASTGHNAENAMNEARNKAANIGGNALQVIDVSTTESSSTVIGEAFNCKL